MFEEILENFKTKHSELIKNLKSRNHIIRVESWVTTGLIKECEEKLDSVEKDYEENYLTLEGSYEYARRACNELLSEVCDDYYVCDSDYLL